MGNGVQEPEVSIPNGDRHYLELPCCCSRFFCFLLVSIPNGDRHYLELLRNKKGEVIRIFRVSIPNGDRHYLELPKRSSFTPYIVLFQSPMGIGITSNYRCKRFILTCTIRFQSPMGIGITSNYLTNLNFLSLASNVSIPNGDRHYLELPYLGQAYIYRVAVSIPNGDRHYLELRKRYAQWGPDV